MKIKASIKNAAAGLCLLSVFLFAACNKTDAPTGANSSNSTISSLLKTASNASIFYSAMTKTGLDTVLSGAGPFTVFVPTDSAMLGYGISPTTIAAISSDSLRQILLYHVLSGVSLMSTTFPQVTASKIIAADGDSVFITNGSNGLFVNGVPVTDEDIIVTNGVIQALSEQPLFPPRGSLWDLVQADTSFSYFVAAVNRASQGTSNIVQELTSGGSYTLLAPNNSAFRQYGWQTPDDINAAIPDSVARIVHYHMVEGRTFASDISSGESFPTVAQEPVQFTSTGLQRQVKGNGSDVNANVLTVNTMAHNGVMFTIDQILVP